MKSEKPEQNAQSALLPSVNGILLVDKAVDWTSHDVAAYLRGVLKTKKIGHSGTLDPMATGLLVVLIGEATKLQSQYQQMPKKYKTKIVLGVETDTWDAAGKVVKTMQVNPFTLEDVNAALAEMTGEITHPVPYYSAKKVKGVAMYKEARKGNNIERQSTITIYKWENITLNEDNTIDLEVSCSSGTYVRSLGYMLGQKLGSVAHITNLRRLAIGGFDVSEALPLEKIKTLKREEILKWLKTI
ncbi:MAG: tRNA pseudouridine(55) synthase TruB [Elusimicrobiota bacterium]|jgi:tRNA pseudouridine55 synthase|nr:tRNA pseudouridine(55) synthase TruB [Elusimicrobiota bacterium]